MPVSYLKLPVGEKPGWENDSEDDAGKSMGLRSAFDSSVIFQSLKQSRDKWLSSTFQKFSSKARGGKPASIVPLPHTIQTRGRCDIEIGPHVFPNTVFYEVHYLSSQSSSAPKPAYYYPQTQSNSWQATTPYGGLPYPAYGQSSFIEKAPPLVASEQTPQPSSKPLLSSLNSSVSITPALINQVNAAASSNPTLANLLQLAAAGKANPEQLKTLGLLIQSLAGPIASTSDHPGTIPPPSITSTLPSSGANTHPTGSSAVSYPPAPLPPVREFDLVIEFSETSTERWIFPRGSTICDRVPDSWTTDATYDVIISTCVPFAKLPPEIAAQPATSTVPQATHDEGAPPQLVTFRLKKVPIAVWDTLSRWVGDENDVRKNRKILEDLKEQDRVYLAHQLPDGPVLTQVQNAAALSFNTKSIKPGQVTASKPKRKPQRKPLVVVDSPSGTPPATKRKRPSQVKNSTPPSQIACFTCGQVDVPLIMGGRFCRPCVDAGKAVTEIPQVRGSCTTPYKFNPYTPPSIKTPIQPPIQPPTPTASTAHVEQPSVSSDQQSSDPPTGQPSDSGNK